LVEGLSPDLAGSTIETCYQPIVRIADRAPLAVEALARLSHPERGMLKPEHFLQQMEDAGRGRELAELMFARALADLQAAWPDPAGSHALAVSVNVPLDALLAPGCLDQLARMRSQAGWPVGRIHIELTESRPVTDLPGLRAVLERARAFGFGVALDDCSPAMPSVAGLLELPFSTVKFDHVLIAASLADGPEAAFVAATIQTAHGRGMTVTAEGVEDEATWDRLRALGADAAQGFLIAEPLPHAEIEPWRRRWVGDAGDGSEDREASGVARQP
jgi:EAL domain-containing protein (putative c-di-GMP-specific phosphodiesterase class I)